MSQATKDSSIFYEVWESQGALDGHTTTPHYRQLAQNVHDFLEGAFEVNLLDSLC
jgi:quinol monooxygenase YgiN